MATDLNQAHLDYAGLAMRTLRELPGHADVQVSMALMGAYLCSQYELSPDVFCDVLRKNIIAAGTDPVLMNRTVERMHRLSTEPDLRALLRGVG